MPVERPVERIPRPAGEPVAPAVAEAALDPLPSLRTLTGRLARLAAARSELTERQRTKCYGELALIHHYLRSWVLDGSLPRRPFAAYLPAWTGHLADHCARIDETAGLYGVQPYLWLRATGYRIVTAERTVSRLARSGARPDSIGEYFSLWKAGLAPRRPNWRAALPRWLACWGDTPESWDHNDYLITHAAFYITDFGNEAAPVEPSDLDRLRRLNEHLLRVSAARADWDLAGECLIALTLLGGHETAEYRRATHGFCRARQADGPGAGWRSYHTTLVDILRCAVALRAAGRDGPRQDGGSR